MPDWNIVASVREGSFVRACQFWSSGCHNRCRDCWVGGRSFVMDGRWLEKVSVYPAEM